MNKLPILIIGFIRVDGIRKLLNSLVIGQISGLYLAIDGPRNSLDLVEQTEIRRIIDEFAKRNKLPLLVWHRDFNLGVAAGIITAIDWFFSKVTFGLILEDDLVIGNDFIPFVTKALPILTEHEDVLMISGNQFFSNSNADGIGASHYPQIWGWATTFARWEIIRSGLLSQQNVEFRDFLSARSSYWAIGSRRALDGTIDTWDLPLVKFMRKELKLCLLPPVNLVMNDGFDRFATHTKSKRFPLGEPIWKLDLSKVKFEIPQIISIEQMDNQLEAQVFGIRWRHILSLPFGLITSLKRKKNRPLITRLAEVDKPSLGSI